MNRTASILASILASSLLQAYEFKSEPTASLVVELFTSEGCSSCPPADQWLSKLTENPDLFTGLVPMAFHIDYWDYIGWKDPYATKEHSRRQRSYAETGAVKSVYTPGFVVNGKEWQRWFFDRKALPKPSDENPGVLSGSVEENRLTATFNTRKELQLNMAYLGMGLQNFVLAGENRNRTLNHDFVVLKHWKSISSIQSDNSRIWTEQLPEVPQVSQQRTALVIWLTEAGSKTPIQATGSYID